MGEGEEADILRVQNLLQSDEALHQFHHHPSSILISNYKNKSLSQNQKLNSRIMKKDEGNTNLIRSLLSTKATTIKEKSSGVEVNRLSVTISTHKLFQLNVSLDLEEEHLVPILPHPIPILPHLINNFKRKHQISIFTQAHKFKPK